jgi:hypothetical protein
MSPLASNPSGCMRFTVVGNPGNRRVALFAAAVRAARLPQPRVLPWLDVACGRVAVEAGAMVRIDSPGEDAEVDRLLRGASEPAEHGRIESFARWYQGFRAALARLGGELARTPGVSVLNQPEDLAVMFDKRRCAARLAAASVPVPPALGTVAGWEELRAALAAAGWHRAFVKPAHGSSASGVVALAIAGGRVRATTSVELARCGRGVRLYNSLRVRTYDDERDVAAVVDALCADGVHVERWFPKAGQDDRAIDLRVVVIAGRPTHAVVRTSRSPLTNLHLGNRRGDLARLREVVGERAWAAAFYSLIYGEESYLTRCLEEIRRVLRRRGLLLAAVHGGVGADHFDSYEGRLIDVTIVARDPDRLAKLAGGAGFRVEELKVREPYEFEHQTPRIYLRASAS